MNEDRPFSFDGYEVGEDRQSLAFLYSLGAGNETHSFREVVVLPEPIPSTVPAPLLLTLMQCLHLILGISYWKTTCSPVIQIRSYSLSTAQAEFWNTVYTKGLGEFFYRNNLDFHGLVRFPVSGSVSNGPVKTAVAEKSLLGIAGGKDSLLSMKLLQAAGLPFTGIVFEKETPYPVIEEVLPFLHGPIMKIKRHIDPHLFELNKTGVYNGHIPISAVYAFLGVAAACFYGYRYMIVSNEKSANFGNVMYRGMEVNHQWSKSEEFERLISGYIASFITPDVKYFSLMRPLNELQITKRFTDYPELFPHFSSCNRNFKVHEKIQDKKWCGECPKCAFVFSLLAAYLPKNTAVSILGKNPFRDESLVPTYRELLGIAEFKPFECVGTPEEVKTALLMIHEKHEYDETPVMQMFVREVLPHIDDRSTLKAKVNTFGDMETLPQEFRKLIHT